MSDCKTSDCQSPVHLGDDDAGLGIFARHLFGPFGHRLTEGYCRRCAHQNLARMWLGLMGLICLVIAVIEWPWKGPLFAVVTLSVWTAILSRWLFPKN